MPAETVLYPGRRAGMQAATIPMQTSQERQYQLVTLSQVGSELTFCQFRTVRTMQHAAVLFQRVRLVRRLDGGRKKHGGVHKTKSHQSTQTGFDARGYLNIP